MSASDDLSIGPVCNSAAPNVGVATRNTLACVGITFLGILYQMRWGTIPDTSWLITVCERVLSGDQLYVEVYETNPPFSIWLYLPPVALAGMLNVAPEILVHAWTYLAAILGFGLACLVVRRAGFPEGSALATLAPAFYALLVLFPGLAFSEREHIGMALFLPLLALLAWHATRPWPRHSRRRFRQHPPAGETLLRTHGSSAGPLRRMAAPQPAADFRARDVGDRLCLHRLSRGGDIASS